MTKEKFNDHADRLKLFLEEKLNVEVAAIFLFGSQNYSLDINNDNYQSDTDTIVFWKPNLNQLLTGEDIKGKNKTIEFEGSDAKLFKVADIIDGFSKLGASFVDVLYTEYKKIYALEEFYDSVYRLRDKIIKYNELKFVKISRYSIKNTIKHLPKELGKNVEFIKKFGFNNKDLQAIVRIGLTLQRYIRTGDMKYSYNFENSPVEKRDLINLKLGINKEGYKLEDAMFIAKTWDEFSELVLNNLLKEDKVELENPDQKLLEKLSEFYFLKK